MLIPIGTKPRIELLAEQAGDVLTRRCESWINNARNQHFNDRCRRPAMPTCIRIRLIHILKGGCHDDPGFQTARNASSGKFRQPVECNIHAECAALALIIRKMAQHVGADISRVHQVFKQQFGVYIGDHQVGFDGAAIL